MEYTKESIKSLLQNIGINVDYCPKNLNDLIKLSKIIYSLTSKNSQFEFENFSDELQKWIINDFISPVFGKILDSAIFKALDEHCDNNGFEWELFEGCINEINLDDINFIDMDLYPTTLKSSTFTVVIPLEIDSLGVEATIHQSLPKKNSIVNKSKI